MNYFFKLLANFRKKFQKKTNFREKFQKINQNH